MASRSGTFWGPKFLRVNEQGKQVFFCAKQRPECVNGETTVPAGDDDAILGNANPDFTLGLTSNGRWGNFDASWLWRGEFGGYVFNNTALVYQTKSNVKQGRNFLKDALNDADAVGEPAIYSSRWIEDRSFVRLQNITLGYTFDARSVSRFSRSLRAYVSGDNLFLFSGYNGYDPEVFVHAWSRRPAASITSPSHAPGRSRPGCRSSSEDTNPMTSFLSKSIRQIGRGAVLAALVALPPLACTDLTEVPNDALTPDNAFKSDAEIIAGIASVYAQTPQPDVGLLQPERDHDGRDSRPNARQRLVRQRPLARDLPPDVDGEQRLGARRHEQQRGTTCSAASRRANLMIEVLEKTGATQNAQAVAELRVLRAFFYYMLQDLFGGVPLVTGTALEANARVSRDSVFKFIESELLATRTHSAGEARCGAVRPPDARRGERDPGEPLHQRRCLHQGPGHQRGRLQLVRRDHGHGWQERLPGRDRCGGRDHLLRRVLAGDGLQGRTSPRPTRARPRTSSSSRSRTSPSLGNELPDAYAALQPAVDGRRWPVERLRDASPRRTTHSTTRPTSATRCGSWASSTASTRASRSTTVRALRSSSRRDQEHRAGDRRLRAFASTSSRRCLTRWTATPTRTTSRTSASPRCT